MESIRNLLPPRTYLHADDRNLITVAFVPFTDPIDEVASTEQDFGASRVFLAPKGQVLLTVDAEMLDADELEQIEELGRRL